ncbi:hypothetical protein BWD42_07680 [Sphingobacterium sp. CZ-UAM]|nr:hypothetical protein BWD42_07680 [Sphingobacterium sp. CZ-UAM]
MFIFFLLALLSCRKQEQREIDPSQEPKRAFNLKTLKEFSRKRSEFVKQKASLKSSTTFPTGGSSANDYLMWDDAVKEVNTTNGKYSYLVPLRGKVNFAPLADSISQKGYAMMDFSTDASGTAVYARLREYRPDQIWIKKLEIFKGKGINGGEYADYKQLIMGEAYNGYIAIYSLKNELQSLIRVKEGKVIGVNYKKR